MSKPHAEIEMIAGVIRVFPSPDKTHGDVYDWAATVHRLNQETIEILGVTQAPTPSQWREIKRCCAAEGIGSIVFCRFKGGKRIKHVHSTGGRR